MVRDVAAYALSGRGLLRLETTVSLDARAGPVFE
jgi:hypothetical protein